MHRTLSRSSKVAYLSEQSEPLDSFDEGEVRELVVCELLAERDREHPADIICDVRMDLVEGFQLHFQTLYEETQIV